MKTNPVMMVVRRKKLKVRRDQKVSERTCVGCREMAAPRELERFVFVEGVGLLHDLRRKAPGRGAWVHRRRECFLKACAGGFSRAMKKRVVVEDAQVLMEEVQRALEQRLWERLTEVFRTRQAVVGQMLVQEGQKKDAFALIILANDAGESTEQKFVQNAGRKGLKVLRRWSGSELGQMAGREFVSVIGVAPGSALERLMEEEARLESWTGDES